MIVEIGMFDVGYFMICGKYGRRGGYFMICGKHGRRGEDIS